MATGKQTVYDVRSSYDAALAEQYGHQSLEDYYKALLTSGKNYATNISSQYYNQNVENVNKKADYDITGAYNNYLKQQRALNTQSRLETGYKEELGELSKNQYNSAYEQAKTTQAKNLATVAQETEELYQSVAKDSSDAATELYDTLMTEVNNKTALFKAVESQLLDETVLAKLGVSTGYKTKSGEEVKFNIYENTPEGIKLSDYGMDVASRLLTSEDFHHYLEEEELLDYYLSNPYKLNEELFGVTDTEYRMTDESKALSYQRLFNTPGYLDSLELTDISKAEFNDNDFYWWDWGKGRGEKASEAAGYLGEYATKLGLTTEEASTVLEAFKSDVSNLHKMEPSGGNSRLLAINPQTNFVGELFGIGTGEAKDNAEKLYYLAAEQLKELAKNKYKK